MTRLNSSIAPAGAVGGVPCQATSPDRLAVSGLRGAAERWRAYFPASAKPNSPQWTRNPAQDPELESSAETSTESDPGRIVPYDCRGSPQVCRSQYSPHNHLAGSYSVPRLSPHLVPLPRPRSW